MTPETGIVWHHPDGRMALQPSRGLMTPETRSMTVARIPLLASTEPGLTTPET